MDIGTLIVHSDVWILALIVHSDVWILAHTLCIQMFGYWHTYCALRCLDIGTLIAHSDVWTLTQLSTGGGGSFVCVLKKSRYSWPTPIPPFQARIRPQWLSELR